MHCFTGCVFGAILSALSLTPGDLRTDPSPSLVPASLPGPRLTSYAYTDPNGQLAFVKYRDANKNFSIKKASDADAGLYKLQELLASHGTVFFVEGEKDVNTLSGLGLIATTSGGSTSWKPQFARWLANRDVVIIPDNDSHGQGFAKQVAESLGGMARIIQLPGIGLKQDVTDWLGMGHTKEELLAIAGKIQHARRWKPLELANADIAIPEGFLEQGIFCRQDLGIVAGKRNVGKTMLMLTYAAAIATGSNFGPYATRRGRVVLFSQEMGEPGIRLRLRRLFGNEQLEQLGENFTIICRDKVCIDSDANMASFAGTIKGIDADVMIFDALFDIKGTARENNNDEMGLAARRMIHQIALPFDCAVLVTHHVGRQKEDGSSNIRGASALEDAASDILFLDRKNNGTSGTFAPPHGKVRHAAAPEGFSYSIEPRPDDRIEVVFGAPVAEADNTLFFVRKVRELLLEHVSLTEERIGAVLGLTDRKTRQVMADFGTASPDANKVSYGGKSTWTLSGVL